MEKYGSIHVARLTVAIYSILYRLYSRKKYGRTGCMSFLPYPSPCGQRSLSATTTAFPSFDHVVFKTREGVFYHI